MSDPFAGMGEGELGTSDDLFASLSLDAAEESVPVAAAADESSPPVPRQQEPETEPTDESFDFGCKSLLSRDIVMTAFAEWWKNQLNNDISCMILLISKL